MADGCVCPWCGEEASDSPDIDFPDGVVETDCAACGQPVRIVTAVRVTRTIEAIEE